MASAKKKQDEKNLKTLRELVSQSGNKECFDCQQRGPTYVNMTIGSFVCTTCSGMLRGLTPPHRVKSISMATFTQDEIDFLRERGNDFCRAIWLGLMPQDTTSAHSSCKDEQKMKDFMSAKYELKRYYLDPAMASQLLNQKSQSEKAQSSTVLQSNSKNSTVIKAPPTKSISSPVPLSTIKSKETELVSSNTIDFVADFSKVPPPSPLTIPLKLPQLVAPPQHSFANFDNNPIFNSPTAVSSTPATSQITPTLAFANSNGTTNTPPPPPEDRYAALKDLDCMMKQASLKDEPISSKAPWNLKDINNVPNTSWSAFDQMPSPFISNPFAGDIWQPSVNILNNNFNNSNNNFQQMEPTVCNPANPFRQTQIPMFSNDFNWFGHDPQNAENISSSHLSPLSNKSWQPTVTGFRANPFVVGSGVGDVTRNSNNPFL
ncbi:arf-GAP domain and FG repeat-containing protein 1 [Phymastichus coffea]|uniref:arf-GAP domain and FG repeat-containing protein 1 n=1 Tax=Phymastichus coffea TaxID=108790 RepID=UPI00273CCA86|nr:arf-GAP domain and FG repeat-containing protein 1 [Phymastichus coffea]